MFLKRIFEKYHENVEIYIDGQVYNENDIPKLLKDWCTNRNIKRTRDFHLKKNGAELFGFHDSPSEFFADVSERSFVEHLANEKIVRYRLLPTKVKNRTARNLELVLLPLYLVFGTLVIILTLPVLVARWCYRHFKDKVDYSKRREN